MMCLRPGRNLLVIVVLLACAQAASAVTVGLNAASQGGEGNKGASFIPAGADFVMTARWGLQSDGFSFDDGQNPAHTAGLVYVNDKGAGVWADAYDKHGKFKPGSDGISGGGPHGQEQLIFTFDSPTRVNSLVVGLTDFEFGSGSDNKDDPVFFVLLNDGTIVTVTEGQLLPAFTGTGGKTGYVDLASLTVPALAGNPLVDVLTTHNSKDHYQIGALSYDLEIPPPVVNQEVPEPATALAALAGVCGIVGYLRRRKSVTG